MAAVLCGVARLSGGKLLFSLRLLQAQRLSNAAILLPMSWLRALFSGFWWESLLKIAVVGGCIYVVIHQFMQVGNVRDQQLLIVESISKKSLLFLIVVFLMPINWFLETLKWWVMMRRETSVTLLQSLKSTFMGVAAGVATPWRSGEFIGRLFALDEQHYIHSFYFSMLGGLAQAFVTASVGLAFLPAFFPSPLIIGVCVGVSIAFLVAYFHFDTVAVWLPRIPVVSNYVRDYSNAKQPDSLTLFGVLFLSIARYGVYVIQWVLVAHILGVNDMIMPLFAAVAVSLLLQSIAPALPLLDIAVRSGIALLVFGMISENTLGIVVSTIVIWMLNLATPAMLGSIWMLHDSYSKTRKYLKGS